MHAKSVFNPNIPIFASNSAEGLHFSAFHFYHFACAVGYVAGITIKVCALSLYILIV